MKNITTNEYYNSKQTRIPVLIAEKLDICDPVLVFDGIMEEIAIWQYLKPEEYKPKGRLGYNRVNKLKTVLLGLRFSLLKPYLFHVKPHRTRLVALSASNTRATVGFDVKLWQMQEPSQCQSII